MASPPIPEFTAEQEQRIALIVVEAVQSERRRSALARLFALPPVTTQAPQGPPQGTDSWAPSPSTTLASNNGNGSPISQHPNGSANHGPKNLRHQNDLEMQQLDSPGGSPTTFRTSEPRSMPSNPSQQSLHYTAESPRSNHQNRSFHSGWRPPALNGPLPLSNLGPNSQPKETTSSLPPNTTDRPPRDPNLVTWSSPTDPSNPKNWPQKKKWIATILVSLFSFLSTFASSMPAPALVTISQELHIISTIVTQIAFAVYVLSFALGPLLSAPLSETYGRFWVLHVSMVLFLAFNLGCGFAQNAGQMIAFRFLAGVGGSSPVVIGGGVISDCFPPEQRGKAFGIYVLAPVLGPAIGPIVGGFVVSATTWRWLFWGTSAATLLVQFIDFFLLPESYAPIILYKRAAALRKETGSLTLYSDADNKTLSKALRTALVRPFRLLATQPIIQVVAIYMAYVFGLFYLILSTFPRTWQGTYGETVKIGGLNYLSLGIGYLAGSQISAFASDRIYRHLKSRNNNKGLPEFRIPLMFIGSALIPMGLFCYGWSAEKRLHWIVPNVGISIFALGALICLQCMQTYIIDSYSRFAASGMAAAVVLRSTAGFGFPLFADYMYNSLGLGWGGSVLGFAGVVVGIPAPFLFWFWGARLRRASRYAAG